jgi:hypothetical protein
MYFLPHDDGKMRIGQSCAIDTRVDFTIVWEENYETIPGKSLGAASTVKHCMEMADLNGFNRAAIFDSGAKCFGIPSEFVPQTVEEALCGPVCPTGIGYGCGSSTAYVLYELTSFSPSSLDSIITFE